MKTFLSLTAQECANVYPKIIKNGTRHIQSAKLLGDNEEYAHAIAHLILGSEELIKGVFLALESKGIIYRQLKNFKKIYFDHSTRHLILKDFYTYWLPLKTLIKIFKRKKLESVSQMIIMYGADILGGVLLTTTNKSWWDKADTLKQKCLYVDFKGVAISPSELGKSDFDQASIHINSLHEDVADFIHFLETVDQEILDDFRKNLNSRDSKAILQLVLDKEKVKG